MRINTNVAAMNALNNLNNTSNAASSEIEKLSSGYRLNRASDDAAGLSIANTLRSTGRGLQQAQQNASQASSVLQIADGATSTISTVLDRMKQLATESASANVTDTDRAKINSEFTSLKSEIDRIVGSTVYQGSKLLDGSFGVSDAGTGTANAVAGFSGLSVAGAQVNKTYTIAKVDATHLSVTDGAVTQSVLVATSGTNQLTFDKLGISFSFTGDPTSGLDAKTIVTANTTSASFRVGSGAASDSDNLIGVSLGDLRATAATGLNLSAVSVDTSANATAALASIDAAVGKINTVIGTIGAAENRLNYATQSVSSLYQNVTAAESVIRDADMAQEYTQYSKFQILQQAGTAMLAQANSSAQSILSILKG